MSDVVGGSEGIKIECSGIAVIGNISESAEAEQLKGKEE